MKNKIMEIVFAVILLMGIIICTICDILLSDTFTWSLVPISSIIFAWVALLPIKRHGKKGIIGSIVILIVCILLYLYVLSGIIKNNEQMLSIGIRMAGISIIYIACIFIIFKAFKKRKFAAMGTSLMLGIPICVMINVNLSDRFSQSLIDIWDLLAILALFILSVLCYIYDMNSKKS